MLKLLYAYCYHISQNKRNQNPSLPYKLTFQGNVIFHLGRPPQIYCRCQLQLENKAHYEQAKLMTKPQDIPPQTNSINTLASNCTEVPKFRLGGHAQSIFQRCDFCFMVNICRRSVDRFGQPRYRLTQGYLGDGGLPLGPCLPP